MMNKSDLYVWIQNNRPDVWDHDLAGPVVDSIMSRDDRPAWGSDEWATWLDGAASEALSAVLDDE